jgi:ribosomal protein L28
MNARITLYLAGMLALLGQSAHAQVAASTPRYAPGVRVELSRPSYESSRVWVPGRYVIERERVWVPGYRVRRWFEPAYETRIHCGRRVRVLVCAGAWRTVETPGHYEYRNVSVWKPGHWVPRGICG